MRMTEGAFGPQSSFFCSLPFVARLPGHIPPVLFVPHPVIPDPFPADLSPCSPTGRGVLPSHVALQADRGLLPGSKTAIPAPRHPSAHLPGSKTAFPAPRVPSADASGSKTAFPAPRAPFADLPGSKTTPSCTPGTFCGPSGEQNDPSLHPGYPSRTLRGAKRPFLLPAGRCGASPRRPFPAPREASADTRQSSHGIHTRSGSTTPLERTVELQVQPVTAAGIYDVSGGRLLFCINGKNCIFAI